jgi:spermidine synthase
VPRLALLFALSGVAALVVETTWLRWFRLLFGATAPAASATLVAFFAGHALGAALAARRAPGWRRPLAVYGALELLAALGALGVPLLLRAGGAATDGVYATLSERPALLGAWRFALALGATLPAAAALGATLPAIGAAAMRRAGALGTRGSALYAWNTLGAAFGTGLGAFVLPDALGVHTTYAAAVALQLAIAGVALAWGRGQEQRSDSPPVPTPAPGPGPRHPGLLTLAAVSGFGALAAQVLLVQAFAQVLNQSVYAFGAVLMVVLLALAAGAAGAAALGRRGRRPSPGWALAAASVCALILPAWLHALTDGLRFLGTALPWPGYLAKALGLVALVAGPLLLCLAVVLPATFAAAGHAEAEADSGRAGALLGRLLAANTAGAIAGALAAPFLLLPAFGPWGAFGALAVLLALGAALAPAASGRERGLRAGVVGAACAASLLVPGSPWQLSPVRLERGERLVEARSTPAGLVAVVERSDGRIIRIDNHYVLGGTSERVHEERQGHLPLLLHGAPESVAFVGTATGISAGAATGHPLREIALVEIVPAVSDAARRHFADANRGVYADPRSRAVLDDARNYLARTPDRFDVLVADLFVPWRSGTGALYTREHFRAVRERLLEDGLFCQWLPLYQLSQREFESVTASFLDVFPTAALFRGDFYGAFPIVALVGFAGSPASAQAVSEAAARLGRAGETDRWVTDPVGVWALYVGPLSTLAGEAATWPRQTDARPRVEFWAARGHAGGGHGVSQPFVGLAWARFARSLQLAGERAGRPLYPDLSAEARSAVAAGSLLQAAGAFFVSGREDEAARALAAASEALPPRLVADALPDPTAADLWHAAPRAP